MSKNSWFRTYAEMVDDEKLGILDFRDRWVFVAIMCCKCSGLLDSNSGDLLLKRLAYKLGVSVDELEKYKITLIDAGLIDHDFQPINWDFRQFVSDSNSAERKRKQRSKERNESNVLLSRDSHNNVTPPYTDIQIQNINNNHLGYINGVEKKEVKGSDFLEQTIPEEKPPTANEHFNAGKLAINLTQKGIRTASVRPEVLLWANDPKVTPELLDEAIIIARQTKGDEPISSAYLVPIVKQLLNPKPLKDWQKNGLPGEIKSPVSATKPWAEPYLEDKGKRLGVFPKPGEERNEFADRVDEAEKLFKPPTIDRRSEPRAKHRPEQLNSILAGCLKTLRH